MDGLLKQQFKLDGFRKGQREIIAATISKKDVLAVLPTGGGKSLCYQLPAAITQQLVIVISPLIALMKDQVASMKKIGLPAGCLYSGQTDDEKREIFNAIHRGGPFILYLSPERAYRDGFHKWIKDRKIALFAVDEAHCVSQWGHDFRKEYAELKILKQLRPDVPVLALTASATPTVLADISRQLSLADPVRMVHGFYRPNLYYQVEICEESEKMDHLLQAIEQTPEGRIIVYCGTRKITEEVAKFLKKHVDSVDYYHAGLSTNERTETQEAYARSDLRILVATNAFGMGIDQPDVRLVVHYQMPANIDSLYQEMGRAGRDGKPSTCVMLYSKKDKGLQSYFIRTAKANSSIKHLRWENLDALISYAEGGECRHSEILTYYKDSQRITKCGHCDSCDPASARKIQIVDRPKTEKIKKASKKKKKDAGVEIVLEGEQLSRFEMLKVWRKEKAGELDVPAFVIFSDKTLRHLATENPDTMDKLREIYGIGEAKLEQLGAEVLRILGDII